jgi:GWxTD domain-containing protein
MIDIPFDIKNTRLENKTTLFLENIPVPNFKSYFDKNEKLLVKSASNLQQNLFLVRYQHDFESASPPTAITNRGVPRTIKVDSISKIQSNEVFQLKKEGLYFITADTVKMSSGITFLCVDEHFPRLTRPEKLIKPLLYISTNQEINEFANAQIPKKALDDFFLKLTSGNPIVAKQAIKSYFRRVATANELFSNYKEGWKTDRGMVYIVLGSPSSVQHSREREVWTYKQNQNFSEITFTFNKKTNQFTENHYELIRYPEYQAYWYPIVEAWRIGSIVE